MWQIRCLHGHSALPARNVTGAANSGAPVTIINQTLDNTGSNIETVTYHITPVGKWLSRER